MTLIATSAILGIYQLLLELPVRGTGFSGQLTIAGRAGALPGCKRRAIENVEVDGLMGGYTIQ